MDAIRTNPEEELKALREEVERLNKEFDQFMHTAAHDLQEPLRIIALYIEMVRIKWKKQQGFSEKDAEEAFNVIHRSASDAAELVRDLVQFSRVGRQPLAIVPVPFKALLKKVLTDFKSKMDKTGVEVSVGEVPETVMCDAALIERVLRILISNSLLYRDPQNGALKIQIAAAKSPEAWTIAVRDNGIGIDSEYHEFIFLPFKRLNKAIPGSGLGLAMAQKIMDRHGGKIWVESAPGKGSVFFFSLPLQTK